jgi:hypothetical protein
MADEIPDKEKMPEGIPVHVEYNPAYVAQSQSRGHVCRGPVIGYGAIVEKATGKVVEVQKFDHTKGEKTILFRDEEGHKKYLKQVEKDVAEGKMVKQDG